MKRSISRFFPALIAIVCTATLFTACQKDKITEPATTLTPELFQKEIKVTDVSGKNTVVLRISSTQAGLLEVRDWSKAFVLEPIFEVPTGNFNEPSEQKQMDDDLPVVNIEIVSEQLEAGAIGTNLHVQPEEGASSRYEYYTNYITGHDSIRVTVKYKCHTVHYFRRVFIWSGWEYRYTYHDRCLPNSWTQYYSSNSYQVCAQVWRNSNTTYTVTHW